MLRRRSKAEKFSSDITFATGAGVAVGLAVMIGIPVGFALLRDDSLRMSDDFAAITASTIAVLLLLKAVEAHGYMREARESFASLHRRMGRPGEPPVEPEDVATAKTAANIGYLSAMSMTVLGLSLTLIILWAGIEGHGPASWLAWLSVGSISFSLGMMILTSMYRFLAEATETTRLYELVSEPTPIETSAETASS